jgi:hypothetical protein
LNLKRFGQILNQRQCKQMTTILLTITANTKELNIEKLPKPTIHLKL